MFENRDLAVGDTRPARNSSSWNLMKRGFTATVAVSAGVDRGGTGLEFKFVVLPDERAALTGLLGRHPFLLPKH